MNAAQKDGCVKHGLESWVTLILNQSSVELCPSACFVNCTSTFVAHTIGLVLHSLKCGIYWVSFYLEKKDSLPINELYLNISFRNFVVFDLASSDHTVPWSDRTGWLDTSQDSSPCLLTAERFATSDSLALSSTEGFLNRRQVAEQEFPRTHTGPVQRVPQLVRSYCF